MTAVPPTLLVLACLSAAPAGEAAAVLDALGAADHARSALATAEADWRDERARLAALAAAARAQAERQEALAAAARASAERAEAARAALPPAGEEAACAAALAELQEDLRARLAVCAAAHLPGAVELPPAPATLAALDRALAAAERAAGTVAVTTATGDGPGGRRVVRLLRAGGAAGWWLGLDGAEGGPARMRAGRLVLAPGGPGDAAAIAAAMAGAEGRDGPLASLPLLWEAP